MRHVLNIQLGELYLMCVAAMTSVFKYYPMYASYMYQTDSTVSLLTVLKYSPPIEGDN